MQFNRDGRRLTRLALRDATTPELRDVVDSQGLHSVRQEGGCPNIYECWEDRETVHPDEFVELKREAEALPYRRVMAALEKVWMHAIWGPSCRPGVRFADGAHRPPVLRSVCSLADT